MRFRFPLFRGTGSDIATIRRIALATGASARCSASRES
jgi:hypothetical protein